MNNFIITGVMGITVLFFAGLNPSFADAGFTTPRLHVEGPYMKDSAGRTVVLRGVNKPGFVDCPDGWWNRPGEKLYDGIGRWDPEAVKANLDQIRDFGCNVVRFHTCIQWWKENPSKFKDPWRNVTYPQDFRRMFKEVASMAAERGIYVVLDLYATTPEMGQKGEQEPLPWPPFSKKPGPLASEGDFITLWKGITRDLGACPNVLFELFNEPHGDEETQQAWFATCQKTVNAIRQTSDNIVIVQWDYGCWVDLDKPPPGNSASTMDWIPRHPLHGSNVVYSTHIYRNSGGGGTFAQKSKTGRSPCWEKEDLQKALHLAGIDRVMNEWKKPLMVGEVGAYTKSTGEERGRELVYFQNILSALNEQGISYAAWAWDAEEHCAHGLLKAISFPVRPNEAGEVLRKALQEGKK